MVPPVLRGRNGLPAGSLFADNPSMAALAQTQDHRALKKPPRHDRLALLSIGTGMSRCRNNQPLTARSRGRDG